MVSKHEKYLGLPSMIGGKRTSFFNDIKLKVLSKISSWQHKIFSNRGKEILIKVVAQVVPAYAMNVFKISIELCNEIQRGMARFWRASKEDRKGMHSTKWEKMSCAKYRGEMRFRDISSFNQAFVANQGWRLI